MSSLREPIKVIADIFAHELPLDAAHITLNDEKWNIPKDEGIFMHLSIIGPSKPISSGSELDTSVTPPIERQRMTSLEAIQVDFMSYNTDARTRHNEIGMALASFYSKQAQEANNLQIAKLTTPLNDTSSLEGTGMLKRFTTTISVTALFVKVKAAEYFDTLATPEIVPNV